jgi:hypothetical protein
VVPVVDHRLLFFAATGGFMAKAAAAPVPKMSLKEFSSMRLRTVDAMFFLMFGLIAIGLVVGIELR